MSQPFAFIIEDDKHLAQAFAEALEDANYKVEVINDGQVAMERLAATIPATIVLDLHIPYVNGSVVLDYIRSQERLAHTRVIIATADDRMALEMKKQADLVLLKPVSYQQLRDLSARLRPRETK